MFEIAKHFRSWSSLDDVARRTQVHGRTIRRDLDVLRALGFTVDRRLRGHTAEFKVRPPRTRLY